MWWFVCSSGKGGPVPSSPSFKRWLLPWPRSIASRSLAAAALGNQPWHTPWPRSRVCGTSRWTALRGFQGGRIVIARSSRQCCPSRSKRRRHTESTQSRIPCTGFRAHNYTTHTHTYCRHMDTNLRTYIRTYIHIHTHRSDAYAHAGTHKSNIHIYTFSC